MTATIDLLATLRNGLSGRASEPRRVIVAGAGIAGLTAAMLLKEAATKSRSSRRGTVSAGSLAAAIKNTYAIHTGMRNELPTAPDA